MEPTPLTTEPTHTHPSPSHPLLTVAVLAMLFVLIGGGQLLRQELEKMQAQRNQDRQEQAAVMASLRAEIAALSQPALAGSDDTLNSTLATANAQLGEISARLNALETAMKTQQAMPVPTGNPSPLTRILLTLKTKLLRGEPYTAELDALAASPALKEQGDALAPLRALADKGAPNDLTLRARFNELLGQQAPGKAPTSPAVERINSRLGGLISIKRRAMGNDDPYASLRALPADTPIPIIAEKITALSEIDRTPFNGWLSDLAARDKAVQAVGTLENKLLPLQ